MGSRGTGLFGRLLAVLAWALVASQPAAAQSDGRVALVIGNGKYVHANPLPNPANDARAVAKALRDVGFDVSAGEDLDRSGMERLLREFLTKASAARVAVVYYAGHGMQVNGRNYLVPVDAKLESAAVLNFETIELDKILASLDDDGRANIVILDACRDNPLSRSFASKSRSAAVGAGLASYSTLGIGTLIAFATAPDKVALDGDRENSPFTESLIRHLRTPGLEVRQMLSRVRDDVARATRNQQIPWDNSSLRGDVYLAGLPQAGAAPAAAPPRAAPVDDRALELALWNAIQSSSQSEAFEDFLRKFPSGIFAGAARQRIEALKPKVAVAAPTAPAPAGATLASVKQRGSLRCGVSGRVQGFSSPDSAGNMAGIDADFCRAVAAAIFDDPAKVQFVPLTAAERFTALQSGTIDVLARNTSKTTARETQLGLRFGAINFYDGQGFMVRRLLQVKSAAELNGATICVQSGTTTELGVAEFMRTNNLKYHPVVFEKYDDVVKAYDVGRCDALTNDASALYLERMRLAKPGDHVILPERISRELLAPAVRAGDEQWLNLVTWTHNAMVAAEDLGVTRANLATFRQSGQPEIRRLLGAEGDIGEGLGLTKDWAVRILRHVGNYGEVFERNLGQASTIKMERGQNASASKGGLQQSPPFR
jgi:general L-amino acid transport system substrate-binding protein